MPASSLSSPKRLLKKASPVDKPAYQPADLLGVRLLDRYEIKDTAGEGNMAHVFLAQDERLETDVVIKIPKADRITDNSFRQRFQQERQLMVQMSHPHVVRVMDVGEYEGLPFVVMQNLQGGNLQDYIDIKNRAGRKLGVGTLKRWLRPISMALDFVGKQGLVHRDVKPANILFDAHKNPFLSDFGLSKLVFGEDPDFDPDLTGAGFIVGTPNYMAPEIVLGSKPTSRSDQYALGMVVYVSLSGKPPMQGASGSATMVNQTQKRLPLLSDIRSDVPKQIALAVQKSLRKKPDNRYSSCEEFADEVIDALKSSTSSSGQRRLSAQRSKGSSVFDEPLLSSGEHEFKSVTTRGRKGLVDCPQCEVPLPFYPIHAGKIGRCIHCQVRLKIGKDLTWLKTVPESLQLKSANQQSGEGASGQSHELIIGEKVFGWQISKKTAAIFAFVLLGTLIVASGFIATKMFSKSDEEQKAEQINTYKSTE